MKLRNIIQRYIQTTQASEEESLTVPMTLNGKDPNVHRKNPKLTQAQQILICTVTLERIVAMRIWAGFHDVHSLALSASISSTLANVFSKGCPLITSFLNGRMLSNQIVLTCNSEAFDKTGCTVKSKC